MPNMSPVVESASPVRGSDAGLMSAQATYTESSSADLCMCTACGVAASDWSVVCRVVVDEPLATDESVNSGVGFN